MKKKSILLIIAAIVTILTIYVVSIAESNEIKIGDTVGLGIGDPKTSIDGGNLFNKENFDYFCGNHAYPFRFDIATETGTTIEFYNIARVEIIGDTAKVTAKTEDSKEYSYSYTEIPEHSGATKGYADVATNKALTLLYYKIKDGTTEVDKYNINPTIVWDGNKYKYIVTNLPTPQKVEGERITLTRTRGAEDDGLGSFTYDYGQFAMWRAISRWRADVAVRLDTDSVSLWNSLAGTLQSSAVEQDKELSDQNKLIARVEAAEYGRILYDEVKNEVENEVENSVDNEYGIEEICDEYETQRKNKEEKEIKVRIDDTTEKTTILGPFKYKFAGTVKTTLKFDGSIIKAENWTIGKYVGSTFTETGKIVSGEEFYIKVPTDKLNGVSSIKFDFQVDGISLYKSTTTLYFFVRSDGKTITGDPKTNLQPIIKIEQNEVLNDPFTDTYKLSSKQVDVSLEKQDASGSALKAEGIKFQIIDDTNVVVAYIKTDASGNGIITDADGNATGAKTVKLITNQEYTLKETTNDIYGYKKINLNLNNIVTISGATITSQSADNIKFKLNNDCASKVTINVKNNKELANVEIVKTGAASAKLENVAFVVQIGSSQYIQLKDNNGNIVATIKGTATINSNNKAQANPKEYHVEYVSSKDNATQFITGSDGKIVINNLEVNKSNTVKYTYTACEVDNPNYGYGSKANTSKTAKLTELKLNEINKIEINNIGGLGNLEIQKYDKDNSSIGLANVGFVIEATTSVANSYRYLALYDQNGELVPSIKDTVTINNKNQANSTEYRVSYYDTNKPYKQLTDTDKAKITTFITGDDGTLTVNNLEIYSLEKNGEKYTYKLIEISNANYGYAVNYQVTDGIKLEVNDTNKVKIYNTRGLGNLKLEKHDKDNPNIVLENVGFAIEVTTSEANKYGYLALYDQSGKLVPSIKATATINDKNQANKTEYMVSYYYTNKPYKELTDKEKANITIFLTGNDGTLTVNNLEVYTAKTGEMYTYKLIETSNPNFGYVVNYQETSSIKLEVNKQKDVDFANIGGLGNLEIQKYDKDNNSIGLANVGFAIEATTSEANSYRYLALYDQNGKLVPSIKDTVTINNKNQANSTEYRVSYYDTNKPYKQLTDTDKAKITTFITGDDGTLTVNNLEIYSLEGNVEKYTYKLIEISNTNYGYVANYQVTDGIQLKVNDTNKVEISNTRELGNLKLRKHDEDNTNIDLPNVGFAIKVTPTGEADKEYGYLALYDQNKKIVPSIKATATINDKNQANKTEYMVSYYYTNKPYQELTDKEKANITIFQTGDDGTLTVNNLEVCAAKTGEQYTYELIEVSNANYGYVVEYQSINIKLKANDTINASLANKLIYTKISGYVWIENAAGKANEYDNVYTNNSSDQILTDLYKLQNGKLVKNSEAVTPVEIKLRNKKTGEFIKTLPDEFDENGKYTFTYVKIAELEDYEVVFIYDGFKYTTVEAKLQEDNGSKVKELASEREVLNNKFASVEDNAQVISTDGTINTIEYYKDGHTSTVSKLNFDTTISANTTNAKYNLNAQPLHNDNVNMGIILREQPKISINSDIYSALMEFEGYKYNYKYNGRQNYYENVNGDDIGVKFEQEYTAQRYTRTVYASDIQAAKDLNKDIKLSITYKIQVANQSQTLNVMPTQIVNYFDSRYEIQAIGLGLDEANHTITNTLNYSRPQEVQGLPKYKSTIIDFRQLIGTESNVKDLYITFNVSREAILDLLNSTSTYHNASEILSYTTYYGKDTVEAGDKIYKPNQNTLYAGIDKMSQPGNIELKLIDHPSGEGTQILDTTNFEDDSTSAPSLILEAAESRKTSGTIWEDTDANTNDNERLGNGIFDQSEKAIKGVKVELYNVDGNGNPTNIATYSNGEPATTITDESGNYTFGHYDETAKKHVGILPGKYVIKYTYNNESYIVGKENINVNDYKSTIITSNVVKNAFNGQNQRWYLTEEDNRYSDARDDISLRKEYSNTDSNFTITNSTYNDILAIQEMNAYTPIMDIGIEFTQSDESDALTLQLVKEVKNVDFGIVERPIVDITIEKEITGLEILAQNGTTIIPMGDPTDINARMQYVRKLDGLVSAEIETDLLQGAKLNLEYTITLVNNSEIDYVESDYYYYGANGRTEITTKPKQVVDYLDATMSLDLTQQEEIWKEKTADEIKALVTQEVYNELSSGNYHILTTNAFETVGAEGEKSVKLYASRALAVSDSIREENKVEIIELLGIRTIKDAIPGNYNPTRSPNEPDEDEVDLVITPPTGTTVNYIVYIIAGIATFAILIVGIVIIKKKLIK